MSSSSSTPQSADRPHASTSFWRDVAHALKGEQHDYTKEKLNRAILLLAVPMVLEMVMESPDTTAACACACITIVRRWKR